MGLIQKAKARLGENQPEHLAPLYWFIAIKRLITVKKSATSALMPGILIKEL
ncbi:hypothetical protein SAMN05444359_10451 [Neolewinella agarilytica]|uniref:Uncharacterized protein n=1 Tax=Neolewinella agarilytica TaxID=478744 RepID=A0A1H9C3G5_9BACT|nr:hypothetical protein SAMN05444359_10451 [Neolewinella agarilytica]